MLMSGDLLIVECRCDSLVSQLKHKVHDQNSALVVRRQRLMLLSDEDGVEFQVLANSHTLASYGIANGTTLQLVMAEMLPPFERVLYFDVVLVSALLEISIALSSRLVFTSALSRSD